MVLSQNFSSATSEAKLAPIKTETSMSRISFIICDINTIPPPSGL